MDYQDPLGRPAATFRIAIAITLFATASLIGQGVRLPVRGGDENEQTTTSGAVLPSDRALSRAMSRARERIADGEYQQALTFLADILSREEDAFLDEATNGLGRLGLKASARQVIGELPPEGRDSFELLYGPAARRLLDTAAEKGDRAGISQVVRQYFHTKAGYEAALVLAQMESDSGHHLAAAQLYQELLASPRALALLDPQLSALAAVNHLAAGRSAEAAEVIKALIARNPSASISIAGRNLPLPGAQSDVAAWLAENTGKPEQRTWQERDWATLHGNASRNARPAGGGPHLRARWQARVVNDPSIEEFLSSRSRQFAERDMPQIPAARPLAVGNVVLMRTPNNLVAVDWQTGKRIWETREEDALDPDELLPVISAVEQNQEGSASANVLEQRLWDDALAMSLASDGERAYVIRGAKISPEEAELEMRLRLMGGAPGGLTQSTNALAAFDLSTEGKLAWELDGARGGSPLSGAFFLGAPLSVDNTLYVFAEIHTAIYLVAIDPANGRPLWQQQLVSLEQSIAVDARRRMAGSSPSYSGGMLICPTASGSIIAVDVVRRELAWVYEYARDALSRAELQIMLQQQIQNQTNRMPRRWLDSAAIIDDGRVYLTPPESQELHCLDLRTGNFLWKQQQGDTLFVGCVDRGIVLLVGSRSVRALRATDNGAPAWQEQTLSLPEGTRTAGQGYLSAGRYYLPISSGAVIEIDVPGGKIVDQIDGDTNALLGNLICAKGSVISQSQLLLDKFEQTEILQQRAEAALARNGDDATALRELAEMNRAAGKTSQAIELLKRAHALAPEDPLVRELLVEHLMSALKENYEATRSELPLLRSLVANPSEQLQLLRIEARGLESAGQRVAAWEAYLRVALAEAGTRTELEIENGHAVRSDRWLGGRFSALWQAASPDERAAFAASVDSHSRDLGIEPNGDSLHDFLNRFGRMPQSEPRRLLLAARLAASQQFEAAELELLQLLESETRENAAAATAMLTRILVASGKHDAAAFYAARLLHEWPDHAVTTDRLNGKQFVESLASESRPFAAALGAGWPRGHISADVSPARAAPTAAADAFGRAERQRPNYRQIRVEQDYQSGFENEKWFVAVDGSQVVGRQGGGTDFATLAIDLAGRGRRAADTNNAHIARLGSLVFLSLSGRIWAIDSRQIGTSGQALWEAYPVSRFAASTTRGERTVARLGSVYDSRSNRKRETNIQYASSLGPVTPSGVVFYDQDRLKCVDPLSGETFWTRRDIPRGCELVGDDEYVIAVNTAQRSLQVIRMADGDLIERRPVADLPWLAVAGRNVATAVIAGGGAGSLPVTIVDIVTGDIRFKADYSRSAVVAMVAPHLVAVYEPTGKFQVLDVRRGTLVVDQSLAEYPKVADIYGFVTGDELFVAISSQFSEGRHRTAGVVNDYPLVNGLIYAFGLKTGRPLWPGPAAVKERGMALVAPPASPFLVFVDHEARRATLDGAGSVKLRMLALDRQTGQAVYRNDELPDLGQEGKIRVRVDPPSTEQSSSGPRSVVIETNTQVVRLTPTDKPRPPEPPALDELVAEREISARGLRGALQRTGDALEMQKQNILNPQNRDENRGRGRRGDQ